MRAILLLSSILFCFLISTAQHLQYEASNQFGGPTFDYLYDMTADAQGNIYSAGIISGDCYLAFPNSADTLISQGVNNIVLVKTSKYGDVVWAKLLSGTGYDHAYSIQVDNSGDLLITGDFSNTVDFDLGVGVTSLSSTGQNQDGFILKLDTAGNFISVEQIECTFRAVVTDAKQTTSGDMYVTGFFKGTADFDLGPGNFLTSSQAGGNPDAFLNKYDNAGTLLWSTHLVTQVAGPSKIELNAAEEPLIYGPFSTAMDVDPSTNVSLLPGSFGSRYTIQYDDSGALLWAESIAISPSSYAIGPVYFDAAGDLISIGRFRDSIDFDPSPTTSILVGTNQGSLFIRKQDANGALLWVKEVVNANGASVGSTLNDDGDILITGAFSGQVDFDPGAAVALRGSATGVESLFVLKLDAAGNFIWVVNYEEQGSSDGLEIISTGNRVVVGTQIRGTVDVNHGTGVHDHSTTSTLDSDIAHIYLSECVSMIDTTLCGTSFTSPSGNYVWTSSGVYVDTLSSSSGCGGAITVNLVLNAADVSVTSDPTGSILSANATNATYQWLDCGQGYAPISGANGPSYSPLGPGSFAVQVTQHGCIDTSACFTSTVGIVESSIGALLSITPNPSNGALFIQVGAGGELVTVELRNAVGQLVPTKQELSPEGIKLKFSGNAGLYFLRIENRQGERVVRKIVKL